MTATANTVPTQAEREAFEARLRAEGYDEILTKTLAPNAVIPEHTHPFDVLAMVVDGEATIDCGQGPRTYRPGDLLEVPRGVVHSEHYGPNGYTFIVGRRHAPR
jgi:quercetin dioxygenase-like cupin family protein